MRKMLPIAVAIYLLLAGSAIAQRATASEVIEVIDGKTLVLETDTGRAIVELQYIEVPQQGTMAETVKQHLRLLALSKKAIYTPHLIRDGRSAGVLEINGVDMAGQMLRDGAAWHVPTMLTGQQAGESETYASFETAAKNEKRGVWANLGLKPPWESPERPAVSSEITASENSPSRRTKPARNPRWGDTGMLQTGYDPASRTGFVGTGLLGVAIDPNHPDQRMAVDISFYYKEDANFRRSGSFVFTLITISPKGMFDKENPLALLGGGPAVTMPVARRTTQVWNGQLIEKLLFRLDRKTIDRLVNSDAAYLKIKNQGLTANIARYWLYSLLQITG